MSTKHSHPSVPSARLRGAAALPRPARRRLPAGGVCWPAVAAATLCGPAAWGGEPPDESLTPQRVGEMSLQELMGVQVTSVAGVGQDWFTTPAAMTVITGDDIRRGGFRTLADALRSAPGVFVGQKDAHDFSVGMRGFNGSLANKTLVLIDGRAVYDPLFGGTFWDVQDVLLEDVERVEVVRGPGATLWGANAVNGVINITTKSARDTQGLLVASGVGTFERAFTEARYGLALDDHSWLRVYGKVFDRADTVLPNGSSVHDDWSMARGGFRFDSERPGDLHLTIQGDAYNTTRVGEETFNAPVPGQNVVFINDIRDYRRSGFNLLGRIEKERESDGWSLQAYYDRTERVTNVQFEVDRDTFDLDWRHHFKLGERHEVVWGLGARYTQDRTQDGYNLLMNPSDGSFTTVSGFVQDTITLVPDRLHAMIGTKLSYNSYTGNEVQPSARLWWTPDDDNTVWASVSRAVRVPSRTEHQGQLIFGYIDSGLLAGGPLSGVIVGLGIQPNDALSSEKLIAYEAGYRRRLGEKLTIDLALFYNDYDSLIYVHDVVSPFDNKGWGESYGGELACNWQAADNWRLKAGYSYTNVQIHGPIASGDELNTPHNLAQVQSFLDLSKDVEFNTALYYVDSVPQEHAAAYLRLDAGVTWRITPKVELAIWGQNLLDERHTEFSDHQAQVERSVYVMATFRF